MKRRSIIIIAASAGLLAGAMLIISWEPATLTALMIYGAITDPGPPKILGNIKCRTPIDCGKESDAFDQIVQNRFPIGTPAKNVEAFLDEQGFKPIGHSINRCRKRGELSANGSWEMDCPAWDQNWNPKNYRAYSWGRFPCGSNAIVLWSEDKAEKISHIEASYDITCL